MALTADRNTPMQAGELIRVPVAAGKTIYAGALVAADANGYATPGAAATTLTYLGRADEHVDNAGGANGDLTVMVRREQAFWFANSASDPVDQSSMGKVCYIADDETVAATDGTGTLSKAGIVLGVDADRGVLIQ